MFINPVDRYSEMIFNCLDDMVSPSNPVRILDKIIDTTLEKYPVKYSYKGVGIVGRPAYSPGTMLKTLIYGTMNGINSIKKLENELYTNLELIWLTGNLHPDYNTISSFRKLNKTLILQFCHDLKKIAQTDYNRIKNEIFKTDKTDAKDSRKLTAAGFVQQISKAESLLFNIEKSVKIRRRKTTAQIALM